MDKKEVLEKASEKKALVGEYEKEKISKSIWISLLVAGIVAVGFIIVEGVLGHFAAVYAIASLCLLWASLFYTLQFFLAKRPAGVLIGSVLNGLAFLFFFVRYILCVTGVWF